LSTARQQPVTRTLHYLIEIATRRRIELVGFPRIFAEQPVHSGPDLSTLNILIPYAVQLRRAFMDE
jgi:hypothetical protein